MSAGDLARQARTERESARALTRIADALERIADALEERVLEEQNPLGDTPTT